MRSVHTYEFRIMTYCGAKISYAVCLLMAEESVCTIVFLWCVNIFMIAHWCPCDCADKWAERRHATFCSPTSFFFHVTLFFSCLEKQNKRELADDPILSIYIFFFVHQPEPCFSMFMRICKWRCVSFNCQVSHVTQTEGSKSTWGGEALVPQTRGEGGQTPSAVIAIHCLHNGNWPFFYFHKLKHSNTLLTHLPAS